MTPIFMKDNDMVLDPDGWTILTKLMMKNECIYCADYEPHYSETWNDAGNVL